MKKGLAQPIPGLPLHHGDPKSEASVAALILSMQFVGIFLPISSFVALGYGELLPDTHLMYILHSSHAISLCTPVALMWLPCAPETAPRPSEIKFAVQSIALPTCSPSQWLWS